MNALNARLRTCTERLKALPELVQPLNSLLEHLRNIDATLIGKVYSIWLLANRLVEEFSMDSLDKELEHLHNQKGALLDFLKRADFLVDGSVPRERPKSSVQENLQQETDDGELPRKKKRKVELETGPGLLFNGLSSRQPDDDLNTEHSEVPSGVNGKSQENVNADQKVKEEDHNSAKASASTDKAVGKGSRSEPYSRQELCTIYIARKMRSLDWDTISWALTRFKTPTVAVLADARAAFDQYHDLILQTMQLCCWPEDSMHLVAYAASECLAAIDRGAWAEELQGFKASKGHLYHMYMQRKLERLYRKTFETAEEKLHRRRRERLLGYEALSREDYERIPPKKRYGVFAAAGGTRTGRKKKTKEEIRQAAEEKAAIRALLRANGLKANGELISERRKPVTLPNQKEASTGPPSATEDQAETVVDKTENNSKQRKSDKDVQARKEPRRKYDIPDKDRVVFSGDLLVNRRINYDIEPGDQPIVHRFQQDGLEQKLQTLKKAAAKSKMRELERDRLRNSNPAYEQKSTSNDYQKTDWMPSHHGGSSLRAHNFTKHANGHERQAQTQYWQPQEHRSPVSKVPITSLLDTNIQSAAKNEMPKHNHTMEAIIPYAIPRSASPHRIKEKVSPVLDKSTGQTTPQDKPRPSMSLSSLLN